jgi:L-lactate dehydrogenase
MQANKIAILGAGHVGSHVAAQILYQGLCHELILIDTDKNKARGHATDLMDGTAYSCYDMHIQAGGYADIADAELAVMCATKSGYESSDRLSELAPTLTAADEVITGLLGCSFRGMIVSISNPCDIIAQYMRKKTGLTVIGTGTALDSARFRVRLARAMHVDASRVQGYTLGEHGDSQVPAFSTVTVDGVPFEDIKKQHPEIDFAAIAKDAVTAGWAIAQGKGCTEFGIGAAAARLIKAILWDEQIILPCSTMLGGPYGAPGVYASVPCRVGKNGAEPIPELPLTLEERQALAHSFGVLRSHLPQAIL